MRLAVCLGLIVVVCATLFPTTRSVQTRTKPKYNVLLIASDDLRPTLGCYDNKIVKTPNIDKLASRAIRFDRAYTQYPLCNPSRTSILTGRYPTQTGVMDNEIYFRAIHPEFVSLPQHFKANGYATLRAGKIFHGGIDDTDAWTEGGEPRNFTGARRPPVNAEGPARTAHSDRIVVLDGDGETNGDYQMATRAIQLLEKYKDQPFFLAIGSAKPHSPPEAPKKFFDLYDVNKIDLPPDFAVRPTAPPGFPEISVARRNTDLFIGRDASPADAREMIRAYYASVSFMDAQVGRVLDALERLHLRKNTIVIFWGDHGYHLGEKGRWSKAYSLFEVATRVPFIISVPGFKPGVSPRTVQLLDMYSTLVELCGLPKPYVPPAKLEGHSLTKLLRSPNAKWEYPALTVVMYQNKLGKSVRTERWHYVMWDEGNAGEMLLDHTVDPLELKNRAGDPAYAETIALMKRHLKQLPVSSEAKPGESRQ
ncbi:MAG TPA: sulfatase [Pyrinomonadaceae bacterium]|nr:sulfatase [Pyrinomonadaceae bacterium]